MLEKISKDFVIDHRTRHVEGLPPFSHSHQFNEIYFLQSGKCHVYIENEKYTLEDGRDRKSTRLNSSHAT